MSLATPSVRVVAALIAHPHPPTRYLVQQRLPGVQRPLLWEFPGGKVEPSECDEEALARECREELGVDLVVGKRLWSCVHRYADLVVDLALYAATIEKGEPQPLRAVQVGYFQPKEMKALPFCEADWPVLEALCSHGL